MLMIVGPLHTQCTLWNVEASGTEVELLLINDKGLRLKDKSKLKGQ